MSNMSEDLTVCAFMSGVCLTATTGAACLYGAGVGLYMAAGAVGGTVINAAGWASHGVTLTHVMQSAAVGSAAVTIPSALGFAIKNCTVKSTEDDDVDGGYFDLFGKTVYNTAVVIGVELASLGLFSSATTTLGGLILGGGADLGYLAAAGGTGGAMTAICVFSLGACCYALCAKTAEQGQLTTESQMYTFKVDPELAKKEEITSEELSEQMFANGIVKVEKLVEAAEQVGKSAIAAQLPMKYGQIEKLYAAKVSFGDKPVLKPSSPDMAR